MRQASPELDAVRRHGRDAVSFQSLRPGLSWWWDEPPPVGTGAAAAYLPAGRSWIAVGTPLTVAGRRALAVQRFIANARAAGRRPVFFGVEDLAPFAGCPQLKVGLQSRLNWSHWEATLKRSRKLREQLRRARAKGVTVRVLSFRDLLPGALLHRAVHRLRDEWLASRATEPMHFLVSIHPFQEPEEHVYLLAERLGKPVQFLSAVPIPARGGWLVEDLLRSRAAPNGTTELMWDTLMRHLRLESAWVTPGLTPLAGRLPWWLRLARIAGSPLYDFEGLRRFRARLLPASWRPVWLVWDRGPSLGVLLDVLRAFAGGRMVPFAWRSLVRHANGPPWAVAVPLVFWTALLGLLWAAGHAPLLGFSSPALACWTAFDAALAWLLFRIARRPLRRRLAGVAVITGLDASFSVWHLRGVGLGASMFGATLRALATVGPILGTVAVLWAMRQAPVSRRGVPSATPRPGHPGGGGAARARRQRSGRVG